MRCTIHASTWINAVTIQSYDEKNTKHETKEEEAKEATNNDFDKQRRTMSLHLFWFFYGNAISPGHPVYTRAEDTHVYTRVHTWKQNGTVRVRGATSTAPIRR